MYCFSMAIRVLASFCILLVIVIVVLSWEAVVIVSVSKGFCFS